jgi:hypothetical protein
MKLYINQLWIATLDDSIETNFEHKSLAIVLNMLYHFSLVLGAWHLSCGQTLTEHIADNAIKGELLSPPIFKQWTSHLTCRTSAIGVMGTIFRQTIRLILEQFPCKSVTEMQAPA